MKKLFFLLSIITYLNSYSQVYKGTLGKFKIYLKIEQFSDENIEAIYFYENHLKNIKLKGKLTKEGYKLYLKYSKLEEKKEVFSLRVNNSDLNGTWINEKTILPVRLSDVKIDFEKLKKDKLKLERGKTQKNKNLEVVWFKEEYSKIELFRLGNGFNKLQRQFLNTKLDSIQNEYALRSLECEEYEISFQIKHLTNQIISFTESYSVYCGGAYLSHGTNHYNFDLTQNKEVENLQELYPNFNFVEHLKEKYKNKDLDPGCKFFEPNNKDAWKYSQFHMTEKKVIIQPSYPHAMAPCREWFEILKVEINK